MSSTDKYVQAAREGVAWLHQQQNPDGSLGDPAHVGMYCYKSAYALGVTGHVVEANRLLSWLKEEMLDTDGALRDGAGTGMATYRITWLAQGAHRLGRFDVSVPLVRWLLDRQAECGGFRSNVEADHVETICTWGAMAPVYAGHLHAGAATAEFMESMIDQQPHPAKFYLSMTLPGQLRTGEGAGFLDMTAPGQGYYHFGIPMLLLARLYGATGEDAHLSTALKLFELTEQCAEDAYAHTSAGKSMTAAAVLYSLTGEERMRDRAVQQADFLLSIQQADRSWTVAGNQDVGVRIDATAEFAIFLTETAAALAAAGVR
ncbi:MAG: hypothetical protein COY42_01185 [Armatimonadetes bacterium CG_4_10_14_0_8_um_filter_66_14]|nr:hypothetical protein [Armatimonadota bacterium]NCO91271.1 hypothetical protein [Armatimonadota bacterium]OIP00540.1 MAG: hypothetical protein AUJ96_18465 [Armatimonadetes bacterium CG2_30_66_41]PIZ50654.1 MAG: hypothetical protein COY42_01185 [Armatimonadetes bacterium CG_4_10_14_0_8_um_filter_66_14]